MRMFTDHSIFAPGKVWWDYLYDLEPTKPLWDQDSIVGCEDILTVEYPNNVLLDVSFLGSTDPRAMFRVDVVVLRDPWTPAESIDCHSFAELEAAILKLNAVAQNWNV